MALPLILALASMAADSKGSQDASDASIAGAESQSRISGLGLDAQKRLLDQSLSLTEADRAAGYAALPALSDYVYDRKAPVGGLSKFRGELMQNALSNLRPEVRDSITRRAAAGEEEASYGRLLDLAKIGQGESATAGQAYGGYSNALSNVLMQGAQNRGDALRDAYSNRQDTTSNVLGSLANIPAYQKQQNYTNSLNRQNAESENFYSGGAGPYENPTYNTTY